MRSLILLSLMAVCAYAFSSKPPVVIPPVVVPVPVGGSVNEYKAHIYPVKGWDAEYSAVVKILQAKMPIDSPCTNVETFLKAVVSAESGFDRTNVFMEPAPLNQKSIGLFQLSLTDKANYKCDFSNENEIKNPIKNIECAYLIFAKLKKSYPSENIWQYGGRYWSVLRWDKFSKWSGKRQSGVKEVLSYTKKNGCNL